MDLFFECGELWILLSYVVQCHLKKDSKKESELPEHYVSSSE